MPLDLTPAPGGRRSSFRVALRMARRDIRRHRGRSFLIVLLIMLPVAGMTGAATLYQSSQRTPEEIVRYELGNAQARFSALASVNAESIQDPLNDVVVASSTGNADPDFIATPPEELLPEGYDVLPMRQLQLTSTVGEALVSLNGVQVDALNPAFTGKFTLLDGRAPESSQEVLVSRGLLERFHLQLGEEFTTSAGTFVPVGTLRDADASDNNSFLYVQPGQVAPAVLGRERELPQSVSYYLVGPEPVSWQQVRAANRQGVAVLSRSVVLDPPPLDQRVVSGAQPRYESTEALTLYASFGLLGALALLEVGLLAGAAFAVGAKRQVRELALLAASGAETPTVRAVVTAAGLWLGAIAVMAGAGMGLGAAAVVVLWVRATGSARLAGLHPDILLTSVAMLMGLAACILAAVAPAGQVARQALLGALKSGRAPAGKGKRTSITGVVLLVTAVGLLAAGWLLGQSAKDPDRQAEQLPLVATLLVGGAVLAVAALVLLTGWLIVRLTSRTQWLSLPLRMAARDSARNRGRTVPAVAAVLAAATLASAGLVLSATQQTWMRDNHWWTALENQARLPLVMDAPLPADGSSQPPMKVDPAELSSRVGKAVGAVAWTRVITAPAPIDCEFGPEVDMTVPVRTENSNCILYSLAVPEEHECPMTPQRRVVDPKDWRCRGSMIRESGSPRGIVVGDAEDIRMMLGTEAGAEALRVLDAGGMVVTNPVFVQDGKVVLRGQDVRTQLQSPSDGSMVHRTVSSTSLPAMAVEPREAVPYYGFVSPETAERLDLRAEPAELLVQLDRRPSAAEADAAAAAVAAVYKQPGAGFWAEPGVSQDNQWMFWLIVAASAVMTLSAAGITTGLALADARNDHVTLAGVGASPRLRKGLAAAQALLTSGLGAALGTIAGAVPAVLIVASTDMRTAVEIPWLHLLALVLAVPLTGSALAWICTRAVLPMSRRGLVG
ncbi:hypothetical protein [Arthrobacter sp. Cr_A7]|uniref:hypothetical protein n=1 Tax=Arthrobacter sp. Cr_A7 TaxID=3031017 RepID=UPI0023DB477B|nr:hypothetical protein [Arthrobacter sp. Cr_A7]MDF2048644.1 hypothetical protein [Arthrobacter sp. Cr_A7]